MKMRKKLAIALALTIGISFTGTVAVPMVLPTSAVEAAAIVQQAPGSTINWENETGADAQAMGIGLPPLNAGPRGIPLARRAAIVDAYRNLAEAVQGVNVNGETTMQDMMILSDIVKTKVDASIKGARILSEGQNSDGSYYVIMSVPLFGVQGIADTALQVAPPPADANAFAPLPAAPAPVQPAYTPAPVPAQPAPQPAYTPAPQPAQPAYTPAPAAPVATPSTTIPLTPGAAYTGVIIDASGMGLEPTFSPAIYDTNGRGIYGTANVDSKTAIAKGMVQYSRDAQQAAANSRAGQNPLIIKASGVKGGASGVHMVHVVVTPEEGDRILAENMKSSMLANCAVVFIR